MLESLAAWVLKYYLGKYVENLNTDQLSIGLLQGQVELENLPLKKEALRQAGLPIQIKAGFIGKIKLQIPIRQIRTAPWVILIEKLYLVAGPVNVEEWDEEAEIQALQAQKINALDALEVQWRANADNQDQGYYASSYSSWLNFGTSVITNIVENLQLNIIDVHFRYEDELCIPEQCFSFGVAIDSLVTQSCNGNWEPGFDSGPVGFKLIELSKFSIYWDDCSIAEMIGEKDTQEFMDCMGKPTYRGRQFVLSHVSGVAHIKKNRSTEPLRSKLTPRIICDVLFDEFPITISDKQYAQMILWLKGVAVIDTRIKNHRFRPHCSVFEDPKAWWRYAYKAVLKKIRPHRYSVDALVKRIKDNVDYVKLFCKILNSPNRNTALTSAEQSTKQRIEYEQSFEELRVLREIAMFKTFPPSPPTQQPKVVSANKGNFLSTWFPQWWYSNNTLGENSAAIDDRSSLDNEIIDAFAHSNDTTYLRRDVVFGLFNFSLKHGSVQLCTALVEHKKVFFKSLMELQFEKVLVGFEYRPRSGSYKTTLALGSIYLKDRLTKETVFPMLISPQTRDSFSHPCETKRSLTQNISRLLSHAMSAPGSSKPVDETLFQLTYEYRPFNSSADYRILMKTQSLDVVYNPEAINWLTDFFSKPLHQSSDTNLRTAARQKYQAIKAATKNELIKNWEKILAGDLSNRKTWEIDLDISAPQIIFVEHFCDKNAVIVVVDFGHLHFSNCFNNGKATLDKKESDDEEAFQTPCSTPPGSGASPATSEPLGLKRSSLSELSLHHKLYDRFELELGEMQVLVGKVRDNWKYAHLKGTSTLHVLDRFNISLQVERRVVHTNDPQFPSLTFFGNLPRLVVHVNEQKISALRAMSAMISDQGLPSPFRSPETTSFNVENEVKSEAPQDDSISEDHSNEMSKLIIMQFTVQQLALEVQSRNRSIAELQVSGVRAAATIRPFDTSVSLSVHSLLLVDALQTFGRDFELLVASHKHVVMDSLSGSIRDSEPTSPIPSGSPEPTDNPASPVAFSQVLTCLHNRGLTSSSSQLMSVPPRVTSPPFQSLYMASSPVIRAASPVALDMEALISVELTFVSGSCPGHEGQPLQIAAIQFNNLDIIANQETIVELLGFARRVFPTSKSAPVRPTPTEKEIEVSKSESASRQSLFDDNSVTEQIPTKTELTFDFHRLNVLLLRAVQKDGALVGRKICTATMTQAKIKATVGEDLSVGGSLGGIQVVDLTPEGMKHQRILSLGADPLGHDTLADLSAGLYSISKFHNDKTAFSFSVKRSLQSGMTDGVEVNVRLASVWYTHSPLLVQELQSCATEFKQYLTNLARSIKSAATEMAIGFVHARAEALAQSLSMSGRLSASLYGGSTSDISSPKKRRRSFTQSVETLGNTPYTPYSPIDDDMLDSIDIKLDVVLDTPVIILPVSSTSDLVFVAHLGKITAKNTHTELNDGWGSKLERFNIEIRNMNLYSVVVPNNLTSTSFSLMTEATLPRPERVYSSYDGKPILHDTVIEIVTERQVGNTMTRSWDFNLESNWDPDHIKVSGCVVGPLKVSLTREQYQQLLEAIDYLFTKPPVISEPEIPPLSKKLGDIQEEENDSMSGVSTLSLDPAVRARMLNSNLMNTAPKQLPPTTQNLSMKVTFDLPVFTVELLGELGCPVENGLVSISFKDFILTYDQSNSQVSHLQMRLKSLVMEDLLVEENSKNRFLVVSSAIPAPPASRAAVSQSCPSFANYQKLLFAQNSLPDNLYEPSVYGPSTGRMPPAPPKTLGMRSFECEYPCTPPPSPRNRSSSENVLSKEENLVFINVTMVDKNHPNYASHYEEMDRIITVDFNCLDVIANVQSWVVVFDFFGIDNSTPSKKDVSQISDYKNESEMSNIPSTGTVEVNSKLDLEVRSLTLVLIRPEYEVAKANISHLSIKTKNTVSQFMWDGRLGSMSLADLTPHGKLYRERFLSSGSQALHVQFISYGNPEETRDTRSCDSELKIEMSSIFYVHTARFLGEIYAYFDRFTQFQAFMVAMRSSDSENEKPQPSSRMLVEINAGSPVVLLPLSSMSPEVLVVDLGKLTVRNRFRRAGSDGTISSNFSEGTTTVSCLLDVMSVDLVNMDLYAGTKYVGSAPVGPDKILEFGNVKVIREGPSLLPDKCHLKLQIDRNLETHLSREVPDICVIGTLAKLEASLDLAQYKLIRGLLTYNLGENLQDLYYSNEPNEFLGAVTAQSNSNEPVWLMSSLHLDLVNVVVHLRQKHGEGVSLACVNFIKSRLVVETFSDRSQDIDLVSAEILITDSRFEGVPENKKYNVFTNILQPLVSKSDLKHSSDLKEKEDKDKVDCDDGPVQAEVHHRRRKNYSKATVLLHNMRLMAVLDWWEIIRDFVASNAVVPVDVGYTGNGIFNASYPVKSSTYISGSSGVVTKCPPLVDNEVVPFEFKLNITDSEIVLVEDTSVSDSNAIILKSTTVISYRPTMLEKPLSCNLNHCEVFSCILGMEEETALSIIDPVTVNMEVTLRTALSEARGIADAVYTSADRALEVQMQHLCIRLSYHDFRMLSQMLESVPKQTYKARTQANEQNQYPDNLRSQVTKLCALGFSIEDCTKALDICEGQLDDAALWLTQNATHVPDDKETALDSRSAVSFQTVEVKLSCLSVCVIDDCRDADVPLLELSMSQLFLKQELEGAGSAKFLFTSDYYNRVLSGWEPFIEPWRCSAKWEQSLTSGLSRNRLQIQIASEDLLNINVTSTLLELYSMVKDNWTEDYCNPTKLSLGTEEFQKSIGSVGLRRRSPFVPFALKNDTGSELWFTVLIKTSENLSDTVVLEQDESWVKVLPNETVPFTFGGKGKVRHRDTHTVRVHQLAVRVDKWKPASPVSVDKVGVYFRQATPIISDKFDLPPVRLVFSITLEGSARKLVTVRSGLIIKNQLTEAVEAKLENRGSYPEAWDTIKLIQISPGQAISTPVTHSLAQIWVRPLNSENLNRYHAFSTAPLEWTKVRNPGELLQEAHQCHSNRDRPYRFVASIHCENYPENPSSNWLQPGHTISLISPLTMINLLPCDLHYSIKEVNIRGYIKPGLSAAFHEVDCDHKFEIFFHIENFPKHGVLLMPMPLSSATCRIKLHDESGRRLDLNASIQVKKGAEIKISVWAPYWIINKTSLPLVFKQEGTTNETAGQFTENEIARVVTPLLFSLSDPDASPTIQARVGALCHPDKNPQWCQHFHLQTGAQVRRLHVSQRDHLPDIVYAIGINIRSGRGRYRNTNIITLSPRFQLHNKSSYKLQFAQKCLATTLNDPGAAATYGTAVKDCSLAWHWPRLDKDLYLCIRLLDIKNCLWSGGFRIDNEDSLHINVRDKHGKMHFLRVEIVLQNATFFVVFTDADSMPPPIRINNFSQVAIQFFQTGTNVESLQSIVRPQTSVDYAWDQPLEPPSLTLVAPGGASASYDISSTIEESSISLTYENFIYIAFTATFKRVDADGSDSVFDPLDVESQQLVLDCVDEYKVILNRKQHGVRSQLWRMTSEGQLQHEGSSPPRDPRSRSSYYSDKILVLDIAGTAPQPTQCVALVLRRPDKRRASTQKWRFTEDGRLCCAHNNMCVQAKDGFFGLRQGSEAVLGPGYEITSNTYNKKVPIEQAVSRMKMRPGSGCLSVSVVSDGPTRVLKIIDPIDTKGSQQYNLMSEKNWSTLTGTSTSVLADINKHDTSELELTINLKAGFGLSIVSRKPPEELLFLHLKGILLNTVRTPSQKTFDCTIQDLQCDNQLFEPQCPVVLYVTKGFREDEPKKHLPAVQISAHKQTCQSTNAHIFKHLIITVKNLSLRIEERLMLKLYAMFGNHTSNETEDAEESDFETQRMVMEATSVHATRYYFGILKFVPSTVRLSVITSAKLPPPLQALKRKLDLTLIKFEDAQVELEPFIKRHPFETAQFLINSILKHFKQELKYQAAYILGSVDFLGSPLGLMNDVSEGFSRLWNEGNVEVLFKNVAHGLSNSTAKVTESLSDGLGKAILDDFHEETRQRIRKLHSGSSSDHIVAGLKGLGLGIYGGVTSVIRQSYEGAVTEGFQGFISGFGKGLVGTVTKPVVGILDLATETASAVRDSSRSSLKSAPPRFRLPRCVVGPGGLLPHYSAKQSQGQEFLYNMNERNYSELLLSYEILRSVSEDLRILISSESIRVFTTSSLNVVLEVLLSNLYHSQALSIEEKHTRQTLHYIELTMRAEGQSGFSETIKRPRVRCDTYEIALSVSDQINYSKALFEERSQTLISSQDFLDD